MFSTCCAHSPTRTRAVLPQALQKLATSRFRLEMLSNAAELVFCVEFARAVKERDEVSFTGSVAHRMSHRCVCVAHAGVALRLHVHQATCGLCR